MALREIAAHFGFSFDAAKLSQIDKGVEAVKGKAKGATSSVTDLVTGLQGMVGAITGGIFLAFANRVREEAAALQDTAEQTGLATDEIQAWTLAANLGGASAQDFTAGLRKLINELATGVDESGQQSKLFKNLSIDTKITYKSVFFMSYVLLEIA